MKLNFTEVAVADTNVDAPDWSKIPARHDDGAAQHLYGLRLPSIPLPATSRDRRLSGECPLNEVLCFRILAEAK
jgi:hypothetical protein